MATTAIGDMARALGLDACGSVVDSFGRLPPAAPLDAYLSQPPATDVQMALAQLVRRGLDPSLIALLRAAFAGDVAAKGLLAWDVLNGAIVERGPYRDQLQSDARAVAAVLPAPGNRFAKIDARVGAPLPGGDAGMRIGPLMCALGGVEIDPADTTPVLLDNSRLFARILHRSHLSTMASFYLADLFFRFQHLPALRDLVEVLLDRSAPGVEELVMTVGGQCDSDFQPTITELATYAHVRTQINSGRSADALVLAKTNRLTFDAAKLTGDAAAAIDPRPTLAYAEVALRNVEPTIAPEHLQALTRLEVPWRYAFHVAIIHDAKNPARDFAASFGVYLQNFGNDGETWYEVARSMSERPKWGIAFLAMLTRELEQLPHDAEVWRAAAWILGDDDSASAAAAGCDARLVEQATLR